MAAEWEGDQQVPRPFYCPLHQLVARTGRLVVFYCELRGPVDRHGSEQAAATQLEEIHQVPEAAVATGRRRRRRGELVNEGWRDEYPDLSDMLPALAR